MHKANNTETYNIKKLNDVEVRELCRVKIGSTF